MFTLSERPWTTNKVSFFARKNNKYQRPVIGHLVDFRIEDILPAAVYKQYKKPNLIGMLPNIIEANQINKYFISIFNNIEIISQAEATKLIESEDFLMLPSNEDSLLWKYTKSPWWEYVVIIDEYEGYIKAPREDKVRPGEPSPKEIDEIIDSYPENQNKIKVISPQTLNKWKDKGISESYRRKLDRI